MAEKILMLALSPTMENGQIVKWTKKEGDTVDTGDVLCEVETDKTTMEYESTSEGVLLKIILPEGGKAEVGDPIAIIGEEGEDVSDLLEQSEPKKDSSSAKREEKSDDKQKDTKDEKSGDKKDDDTIVQLSDAKSKKGVDSNGHIKASPLARRLAEQNNLDLKQIEGTGPEGRIVKRDIEDALEKGTAASSGKASRPTGVDEIIPVSEKRKIIAQRLSESKFSAPHFYLKLTVAMDLILESRENLNRSLKDNKVSMNAFLMKFCAMAVTKHPVINSGWHGDTIIRKASIDIGLAVAQPDGLITPIVRDCGNKGIMEIDAELKDLIERARTNKLSSDEYTGATFTISSLGSYGIEEFTAIINPPASTILAIGSIKKEPVVDENDELVIKSNMKLTLSCDHRVVDGAVGALFLKELKDMMENPIRVMF